MRCSRSASSAGAQRQKRAARDAIGAALAGFEELGAATWVEKARAELGRIGGRTRDEGLTAAERRVAALVAEGRTNREVAAALFLGERTVETHLSHVYAKLGVRSRSRARADVRSARRAKFRGTHDFKLSALAYGRVVCRATSSRRSLHAAPQVSVQAREQRARSAAEEMTREGTRVGFEGSIHVPEDEICFFTFAAPSGREAALVAQRAGSSRFASSRRSRHRRRNHEVENHQSRARS